MKVIIQIPCLNEAGTLAIALGDLPKTLPGVDVVEWLVIDDGSEDNTSEVARQNGVHHVVRFPSNQGLAKAFMLGIRTGLELGADIIVNTDADNQYNGADIEKLVAPIVAQEADIVIGARPISNIQHFSGIKKRLQGLGSSFVRVMSGTSVADAPSGFRAYSRSAACSMNVFSDHTYTLETIVQAGQKNLSVVSVPIRVNGDLRPSRLVRSIPSYIRKSVLTVFRILVVYRPFRFFLMVGAVLFGTGAAIGLRFLWHYFHGDGGGHIQSLLLGSVLLIMGFNTFMMGFMADLLSVNRRLLEELQAYQRASQKAATGAPISAGDNAADIGALN